MTTSESAWIESDVNFQSRIAKRLFDLVVAVPTLIVLSPLLAAVAVAVRCQLGRPILFRQQRPGLAGKPFWMLKFRTMTDARDPSGELRTDAERMTALGCWLRQTSLDELPELWNVLRGEMSLVGPRPLLMQYLNRYTPEQARRHLVPPGITGWAQVNGRNAIDWKRKLELDVWYVDHWSWPLDLKILGRTAIQVLRRDGIRSKGHATMPEFVGAASPGAEPSPAADPLSDAIAVIGAGGHAKVVIDALRASGFTNLAAYDDDPARWGKTVNAVPIVGATEQLRQCPGRAAVIAIGDNRHRAVLAAALPCRWMTVVHPAATVSPDAVVEPGAVIMAGAVVQPAATVGAHVIVNTASSVDHDCRVGDFVHLAPGTRLAGGVRVGDLSFCGIGSSVLPGVQLGEGAILGAGAVAVEDVPSGAVAMGVPARVRTEPRKVA